MAADLRIEEFNVGPVMTNCYFLANVDTMEVLIVDPGDWADKLISVIKDRGYKPAAVLLTHGHFDHAGAVAAVAGAFSIPVYAHEDERETLENPRINMSGGWMGAGESYHADVWLTDGEEFDLAGFHIRAILVPGHTTGGCCYYLEEQKVLVSGDTLFCGSIGRSDFPGGDGAVLIGTIREKLFALPNDTVVLPGHDRRTTIGFEKQYNPFF